MFIYIEKLDGEYAYIRIDEIQYIEGIKEVRSNIVPTEVGLNKKTNPKPKHSRIYLKKYSGDMNSHYIEVKESVAYIKEIIKNELGGDL